MKRRDTHIIVPSDINPDKLIPELIEFFAKLVGARDEFELEEVTGEVILKAMTKAYARILAANKILPDEIIEHLEGISVGRSSKSDDEDCEDCEARHICDSLPPADGIH
jgi:hypothetical protein